MNIWALDKHETIKHLLLLLVHEVGADAINLLDVHALDYKAIRLGFDDSNATVYLYTYGQANEHYGLSLEYPSFENDNVGEIEEIYEGICFDKLLEIIKLHLQ